jgi:hypothetical protein
MDMGNRAEFFFFLFIYSAGMYVYIISIIIGMDMNIYCGILNYAMIFIYAVSLLAVLC